MCKKANKMSIDQIIDPIWNYCEFEIGNDEILENIGRVDCNDINNVLDVIIDNTNVFIEKIEYIRYTFF